MPAVILTGIPLFHIILLPMKTQFIEILAGIKEGELVDDVFLVKSRQTSLRKDGRPYMMIKLADRTGVIDGKVWENVVEFSEKFSAEDFVKIRGVISIYQGTREVNIKNIERVDDRIVNMRDFLAVSEFDPDKMAEDLYTIINNIGNPYLKRLLLLFYEDKEFIGLFKIAPAAKDIHHAFLGGLLEHSLEIVRLGIDIKRHYKDVDADILITGAILHDIGKIRELKYKRVADYTDEGRLIGHITIGVEMIDEKIRLIEGFPQKLAVHLRHLILSHQGTYEWGSPKMPQTLEAIILHYLDDMSAKINIFRKSFAGGTKEHGELISYSKALGRYLYKSVYDDPLSEINPPTSEHNKDNTNSDTAGAVQEKLL